jgi:hypothetical protein
MKRKDELTQEMIALIDREIHDNVDSDGDFSIESDINLDGYELLVIEGTSDDNTQYIPETRDSPGYRDGHISYTVTLLSLALKDTDMEESHDFEPSDFNGRIEY